MLDSNIKPSVTTSEVVDLESKHELGDIVNTPNASEFKKPEFSPEYKQRHIANLKGVCEWNQEDLLNHKAYNRLLQKGFSSLDADNIIALGIEAKEAWLTDWVCPEISPAFKLNIAAELVTKYQISSDDLNKQTQAIFHWIETNYPHLLRATEIAIARRVALESKTINKKALQSLEKKFP